MDLLRCLSDEDAGTRIQIFPTFTPRFPITVRLKENNLLIEDLLPSPMLFFPNREKSQGRAVGSLEGPPDTREASFSLCSIFVLVCDLSENQEEKVCSVEILLVEKKTEAQEGQVTFPRSFQCLQQSRTSDVVLPDPLGTTFTPAPGNPKGRRNPRVPRNSW